MTDLRPYLEQLKQDVPDILMVDDDPIFTEILEFKFIEKRCNFHHFQSGTQFKEYYRLGGKVDLLLLDLFIPGEDSFEVLSVFRQSSHTSPVIVLSSDEDPPREMLAKYLSLRMVSFIGKTEFMRSMDECLKGII